MKKMVVIFVCLLMVGSVLGMSAVAFAGKPGGKPPKDEEKLAEGEETLITENPMWYRNDPRIFGDNIVWVDKYNDISYLYLYELPDGPPTAIHELEGSLRHPEIYGDKIVFKDQILGGDTYLYEFNANDAYLIKENNNAAPDIYENKIVYFGINDVWMYDLGPNGEYGGGDDQEYQLPSGGDTSLLGPPRIFGNIIVWAEDDLTTEEDWNIVIYDLGGDGIPGGTGDNSDTKAILERPGRQNDPAIYGNIIVWTDDRNTKGGGQGKTANLDIYMYDLGPDGEYGTGDDGGEYQLTSNKDSQYYPDIYGNIIVWQDNRNDHKDVYMFDLGPDGEYGTGDDGEGEYRVTINEANQRYPRIFGNRIVYLDDRSPVGSDIYMFTLTQ